MKKQILLLAIFILPFYFLKAQDVSKETIQWNASGFKDLDTNETVANACQFITYGTSKIKWIQDEGRAVVEWGVAATSGPWTDASKNGAYKYSFKDGAMSGTLTMKKDANGWVAELILTGGSNDIHLQYTVSSIQKI
jgi:hypothetical protein